MQFKLSENDRYFIFVTYTMRYNRRSDVKHADTGIRYDTDNDNIGNADISR